MCETAKIIEMIKAVFKCEPVLDLSFGFLMYSYPTQCRCVTFTELSIVQKISKLVLVHTSRAVTAQ